MSVLKIFQTDQEAALFVKQLRAICMLIEGDGDRVQPVAPTYPSEWDPVEPNVSLSFVDIAQTLMEHARADPCYSASQLDALEHYFHMFQEEHQNEIRIQRIHLSACSFRALMVKYSNGGCMEVVRWTARKNERGSEFMQNIVENAWQQTPTFVHFYQSDIALILRCYCTLVPPIFPVEKK